MYISVRVLLWTYDDVLVNKIEFAICTYQCEFPYEIIYCVFLLMQGNLRSLSKFSY